MGDQIGQCVDTSAIETRYRQITAERRFHVGRLASAALMWTQGRDWISRHAGLLYSQASALTAADHWPDAAGREFRSRADRDAAIMRSWVDPSGLANLALADGLPPTGGDPASTVIHCLDDLALGISEAQTKVEQLRNDFARLSIEEQAEQFDDVYRAIMTEIDGLKPKYEAATTALHKAKGLEWRGPRRAAQDPPGPASKPGPAATAPGATTPAPANPAPTAAPPSTPDEPATEDPVKAALAEAPNALDAASQALQGLQQLMGGGVGSPSPTDLGSPTPAEVAERLSGLGDGSPGGAGLPSLAGGGADPAGGGFGAAGLPAAAPPAPPALPAPDPGSTTAAAARVLGTAAATGAAAAAGSPGMLPPMQPRGAGGKAAAEIKPGDAEHAATGRSRKPGATPGVPLLGRAGRRGSAATPPPASRRRWDTENDTVRLLDEELWQVDKTDGAARFRAGH
ncbi:hypothetical protein H4696_002646 [Amycolatopsis lexingtonensis]|uniref:PPE family protein n=1 Tax=Amycolatopsis lexingtonensis TaxID=218822 RepID=A0ABR9HX89_9PSEU|nr:hypothetical protein [Amycolatopsis lexingtonensis]MBE1495546.1 hypothetical protein [Amycolatopsis lexingtonensis]